VRRFFVLTITLAALTQAPTGVCEPGAEHWPTGETAAPHLWVLKSAGAVFTPTDPGFLSARGITILAHLPDGALLVAGSSAENLPDTVAEPWTGRQAVARLENELPSCGRRMVCDRPLSLVVGFSPGSDVDGTVSFLSAAGVEVAWVDFSALVPQIGIRVPPDVYPFLVDELRAMPHLVWADVQSGARLRNSDSVWLCQTGSESDLKIHDLGLRGENQVIAIMDTGIDADSCFFHDDQRPLPPTNDDTGTVVDSEQRKILAVDFYWDAELPTPGTGDWDTQGHGTHVAGSAAGDGDGDGRHQGHDGMAPAAKLVIQDGGAAVDDCADLPGLGCPVRPLEPMLAQAYAQGARIHSNSWGDEENTFPFNRYTERTADIDRFCWTHQDFLVVFAAGNAGPSLNSVGSPATGKNVLAVGATRHGDEQPPCIVGFSSRGWTADGRIKPDVVAPGTSVLSALSDRDVHTGNCTVTTMSGTSMACPTTAGLAALVRQYFVDGFYPDGVENAESGFEPSAALLRAMLIASAVDLTTLGCDFIQPIPSRDQGWGLVQLDRALHFAGDNERLMVIDRMHTFADTDAASVRHSVELPDDGPLKVVLVWTDPPSTSLAETNLVNDLDLVVTGPDGDFLGNRLNGGRSVVGGFADRLNNVEVVWLPEARAGRWQIGVGAHFIAEGPQGFALAVVGEFEEQQAGRSPRKPAGRRFTSARRGGAPQSSHGS